MERLEPPDKHLLGFGETDICLLLLPAREIPRISRKLLSVRCKICYILASPPKRHASEQPRTCENASEERQRLEHSNIFGGEARNLILKFILCHIFLLLILHSSFFLLSFSSSTPTCHETERESHIPKKSPLPSAPAHIACVSPLILFALDKYRNNFITDKSGKKWLIAEI